MDCYPVINSEARRDAAAEQKPMIRRVTLSFSIIVSTSLWGQTFFSRQSSLVAQLAFFNQSKLKTIKNRKSDPIESHSFAG